MCSVSGVLILYLFCAVRLVIPVELPWTKEVWGGEFYNWAYEAVRYEVVADVNIQIYQMFYLVWMAGAVFFMGKLAASYGKLIKLLNRIPIRKDEKAEAILTTVLKNKEKRPEIRRTSAIEIPPYFLYHSIQL